uniref:C2H2-type domain-containing protein n=1 Tax=Anopheles minimus TaxID=112268 RepID=A0A182W852_9DIPT
MPKKLYTYCCRLCLHDGTVNRLLEIFSVKGLDEKLLKVFNIKVTTQDSCTTNICLPCFQETLTLELQMQQFQKHKQIILSNQQQLQTNAPAATSALSSAPLKQAVISTKCNQSEPKLSETVCVPIVPVKIHQTAGNISPKKQLNHYSNASTQPDVAKTYKNSSAKVTDKNAPSQPKETSKEPPSKKKPSDGSRKSLSKNAKSASAVNQLQLTDKQNSQRTPEKATGGNLEKSAGSAPKNIPSNAANGQSSVKKTEPKKSAKPKTARRDSVIIKAKETLPQYGPQNSEKGVNSIEMHKNADSNNQIVVKIIRPVPNSSAVEIEQTIPAHVIDIQPPTTQNSNNPTNTLLKDVLVKSSKIPQLRYVLPATLPGTPVSQPSVQSVHSPGVNSTPTVEPLQGGLCSIPLGNISDNIFPHESPTVSIVSTVHQTVPNSNNAPVTANIQQLAATTQPQINTSAPTTITNSQQASSSRDSIVSNIVTPGAITKRRHSTFIRVSSNLFDEPPEKAQFAMLNNNQFIRNNKSVTNTPALTPLTHSPVLSQGSTLRIVPNPQMTMPFNTFDMVNRYPLQNHVVAIQQPHVTTARSNAPTQPIATNSNFGINYGPSYVPRTVNTAVTSVSTTTQQPQLTAYAPVQQHPSLMNNVSNNYPTFINNQGGQLSQPGHSNNSSLPNPTPDQAIRACFRCNLCSSYFVLESSLTIHLRRIHNVDKNDRTSSQIFDVLICNTLLSRIRRKSIADPLLLSNNRT